MNSKILLLIIFSFFCLNYNARSATYYISSSSGNDSNSGFQPALPWKTLDRLNNQTVVAGDSVLLKCGDTFFGTLILKATGTISSPIYFGKYGNGNLPIISGFKKLLGWTNNGNIYAVTDSNYVKSIWLNNNWMQSARYPNKGYIQTYFNGLNTAVYAPYLNQSDGYWNNSTAVIRTSGFQCETAHINSFSQGFLNFSNPLSTTIPLFNGFFIEDFLPALDTVNEWFCDTATNQVLIIPPTNIDLNFSDVEASVLNFGFLSDSLVNYITINNICFVGQSKDAIRFSNSISHNKIINCQFKKIRQHAINLLGVSNSVDISYNDISDCGDDAIFGYFFSQCSFQNNKILRTGIRIGFGTEQIYFPKAININIGASNSVTDNYIDSVGYVGVNLYGYSNSIERNVIKNSMLTLEGGGAIKLSESNTHDNILRNNFILDTRFNIEGTTIKSPVSSGIYLGLSCHGNTIESNTIVNSISYGIYITGYNHDHLIKNNTFFNNQYGQIYINDGDQLNSTNNILLQHNILYSLNDKQPTLQLSGKSYDFLPIKGDSNYYCNPYDYYPIRQQSDFDSFVVDKPFSLSLWNQITQQDSNSHVSNVHWQNYSVTDTIGSELITNGEFTNNFDNWITQPDTNCSLLLDNLTMMDGGCVKFEVTDTLPSDKSKLISAPFPMDQNQFYQLSYSSSGTKDGILFSNIIQHYSPYIEIGLSKYFPIETSRKDINYLFQAQRNDNPMVLDFYLHRSDSLVYFDNISLLPVTVLKHDSSRMSVLIMNNSPNVSTVTLSADSIFRDLDGNLVGGSYTLQPYSSYVLVLDSPLNLVSVKEIQEPEGIKLFPNPVQSEFGKLFIQLPDGDKYDFEIYDLLGQKQQSGKFTGSTLNTVTLKNYPAGMYILNIHSPKQQWQQKIIVVN